MMISNLFLKVILCGVVILLTYLFYISSIINVKSIPSIILLKNNGNMKYILQWTSATAVPVVYMGKGQSGFIDRNCTYTNCFVTNDRKHLGSYTKFDLIVFAGPQLNSKDLPNERSPHQKYAFVSIESAHYYPVCNKVFDNFFNWTLTYRLDSESRWGYMVIRDKNGEIVGPNKEMHWMETASMDPVNQTLKNVFKNKSKAAAWFVSNCHTKSKREWIVKNLTTELEKYNLTIDVYGKCDKLKCDRADEDQCNRMLEKDYYFYLSFENSFDEDYATEKLLNPLRFNTVPIVYGGANYTRFMPDGIYLDAKAMDSKDLASKISHLIKNPEEYANLFRWKNHYSYHYKWEDVKTDDYCSICSLLNNEVKVKQYSNYENFRQWWNTMNKCR